jgi:dienelactone hydrolase
MMDTTLSATVVAAAAQAGDPGAVRTLSEETDFIIKASAVRQIPAEKIQVSRKACVHEVAGIPERQTALLNRRTTGLLVGILLAVWLPTARSAQGQLSVRVTSPEMNADVSADPNLALAAETNAPGGAIARVEFFDGNKLVGIATQAPFKTTYRPDKAQSNFCITAKITDTSGRSVVSPPVTCTSIGSIPRQYKSYDYEETVNTAMKNSPTPTQRLKQVRVTIPKDLTTVRGILVVADGFGGDTRDDYKQLQNGEFLCLHDFAFLGTKGFDGHIESFQAMQNALKDAAKRSNHPELVNVPYVTTGFSNGGGYSGRLVGFCPDRVIASVPVCAVLPRDMVNVANPTVRDPLNDACLATPTCSITGELEKNVPPLVEPTLEIYRPKGALFAWMTAQGYGHTGAAGQDVMTIPMLDAAIRLRYPPNADVRKGPVKLKTIDPASGWVADDTTWHSGLTVIAPANQFKGDIGKSSWLLNEDIAFIYRAYSTYDKPLIIVSPPASWSQHRVWDPGSNVTIVVDDSKFPHWRSLEFYDGARKFGEVTNAPPQCTALDLAAGFHVFSVLGTDANGSIRPSNPVLVVVRKLPAVSTQPVVNPPPALRPGQSFTLQFPDLPPTFDELVDPKGIKPQMTVFLPKNYDPARKHPLLIFLNGGTGGRGTNPGVARALTEETNFVCASLPLFHKAAPGSPGYDLIIREEDGKYMWPLHKRMLAELERVVPNIDPARRVIGGFSNGAHSAQEMIDQSDGEAARMFSAVFLVNGGGRMKRYDLLKDKPLLFVYGGTAMRPERLEEIIAAAKAGGVDVTAYGMKGIGHAFPESEYPAVRKWLCGPAISRPASDLDHPARDGGLPVGRTGDQQ